MWSPLNGQLCNEQRHREADAGKHAPPASIPQSRLGGRMAMPERTASQLKVMTPRGFPTVSSMISSRSTGESLSSNATTKNSVIRASLIQSRNERAVSSEPIRMPTGSSQNLRNWWA